MVTESSRFRLAINGYGRIGKSVLRALHEPGSVHSDALSIVAINDLASSEAVQYLTRHDTTHGRFPGVVRQIEGGESGALLEVNGEKVVILRRPEVQMLDWGALDIDLVLECTGTLKTRNSAAAHIEQGARRVLISNPAESSVDATIVYGVNQHKIEPAHQIVSNASCSTNCVVPVIVALDAAFGVQRGSVTTIHAAMNDQPLIDSWQPGDLRKTRSGMASIVPVATELAKGIERLLPAMTGLFSANAVRVPVLNGSLIDLTVELEKPADVDAVNAALYAASSGYCGVLGYTEEPLISTDFNHDPRSAVIDGSQTCISDSHHCKVMIWFDNEWGFANRMLDVARYWLDDSFRKAVERKITSNIA